jgi:uroporphyrinogen-III synthase
MNAQVERTRKLTRVVITRSKKGNAELARKLRALGVEPVAVDTIGFLPPKDWSGVDASLRGLADFDWLLITSPTGAEFFAQRMRELSLALPWQGRPAVAAVGEKTGAALKSEGIGVDFVPSDYTTRALADQLPRGPGDRVLVLRADVGSPELVPALERREFRVRDLPIYRTCSSGAREATPEVDGAEAVLFASPSAVEAFVGKLGPARTASLAGKALAVCIGPVTGEAARDSGFKRVRVPDDHTTDGLVRCLASVAEGVE